MKLAQREVCSAMYNLVLEKIMTKNKLKSVWLWNVKLEYVLRESPPLIKVPRTCCGFWTFLLVSTHLIILDLLDYDPIISRIKFWWFSFFGKLQTDLWKPRYHLITNATFAPKNLGGEFGTFDFLRLDFFCDCVFGIFLYLCVCIRLCICLCVCISVFFLYLSFLLFLIIFFCSPSVSICNRAVGSWTKSFDLVQKIPLSPLPRSLQPADSW